ncbi:MAG: class I SAM-dependent methyltransferase, partial [Pseudomonadota bacterium]
MDLWNDELVQIVEADAPRGAWSEYVASGLPEAIGGLHLCFALVGAWRTGMLERLKSSQRLPVATVVGDLDPQMAGDLLRYLSIRGVIVTDDTDGTVALTEAGLRMTNDVSLAQLGFYVEAYSPVLSRIADLMTGKATYGTDVHRDGAALGEHCATLFRVFHTPIILDVLRSWNVTSMVDLGCGGGMLLIDACLHQPELKGHGLDISSGAIDHARVLAENEGLSDRLTFSVADAFDPSTWPAECREADAICAVGAVHEHFRDGEDAVVNILN